MLLEEYNEAETMELFREEGREAMLVNIYNSQKNGIITLEQAAAIAGMSVDEFLQKMTVPKQ